MDAELEENLELRLDIQELRLGLALAGSGDSATLGWVCDFSALERVRKAGLFDCDFVVTVGTGAGGNGDGGFVG